MFPRHLGVERRDRIGQWVDAMRYWEPRRLVYNAVLVAVVIGWVVAKWAEFVAVASWHSLLQLFVLGFFANVCYCAAYAVDLPLQSSTVCGTWLRLRSGLWLAGTVFAAVLTFYWIADEIYPYLGG
jgi:hypothetical protein